MALNAAHEFSDELENLSDQEKALLKKSMDDLVRENPATSLAAQRTKKLLLKAGDSALELGRKILVDVLSETAKKILMGP